MNSWKKVMIKPLDSMQTAIETLNSQSLRIVLVVDGSSRLIGTITDGDIRRALLKHLTMDSPVSEFMFKNPTVAKSTDSKSVIFSIMKKKGIMQIPIVDEDMIVIGIETLKNIVGRDKYDNPVFLMAGGFGTRLSPLTENMPKPLLKVGKKPILETILEQFVSAGFHDFYISTHYKAWLVHDYFGDGKNWGVTIQYVHEEEPLGTAGALGLLPKINIELPIIMMNGDILTKVNIKELIDFHIEHGSDATMCVREYDFRIPYGVVTAKDNLVTNIIEKPVQKFFVNAGIYVLNPEIVSYVKHSSYLDMPSLLDETIKKSGKVSMFPIHEYWLDIGQMDQFEKAQVDVQEHFYD